MSASATSDHDQRLKVLLKEFFEQFFLCFFPAWAARFDFGDVTWLDKEVFLAPPRGEKRQLDLVARLRIRSGAPPPQPGLTELLALVAGIFMLRRQNWARWLTVAWMLFHVALSAFPPFHGLVVHVLIFGGIAWLLLRSDASQYFRGTGDATS